MKLEKLQLLASFYVLLDKRCLIPGCDFGLFQTRRGLRCRRGIESQENPRLKRRDTVMRNQPAALVIEVVDKCAHRRSVAP